MEKIRVMFDTNAFDNFFKNDIDIDKFKDRCEVFITHIQRDELNKIPDLEKLNSITNLVKEIDTNMLPTESAVFGLSKYNFCKFGDGVSYDHIRGLLDNIKKPNNAADALIVETSIKNGLILITNDGYGFIRTGRNKDRGLYHICLDYGGNAMFFEDFIKEYKLNL